MKFIVIYKNGETIEMDGNDFEYVAYNAPDLKDVISIVSIPES